MGVEVAQQHGIAVGMIENRVEVRSVARSSRSWRNIDVVDSDRRMSKVNFDGLDFQMLVVGEESINIDWLKLDVVVDEDGQTAPATTSRTIPPEEGIVSKRGIGHVGPKLRLLYAGDLDVIFMEENFELMPGSVDGVGVELEESRNWRRRTSRTTRIRRAGIR